MNQENIDPLPGRAYQLGFEFEEKYGACSQMVLTTVEELFGNLNKEIVKASHPLAGGGAGCEDGTCGALSGGLLAIGAEFGRERSNFGLDIDSTHKKAGRRLHDRFVQNFGSCICREVRDAINDLPVSLGGETPTKEMKVSNCAGVVGATASWTACILRDYGLKPSEFS
jgi:C_GCAxxG_C_C family probable redox protein